jgi:hypothetical protein
VLVFEQRHFLRFHNAVNSGRTCIYFGKLFKNNVLHCSLSGMVSYLNLLIVEQVLADHQAPNFLARGLLGSGIMMELV